MPLSATSCTTGGGNLRVRPVASIYCATDVATPNVFHPIGCLLYKVTPPALSRGTIVDDTAINMDGDCFAVGGQSTSCALLPVTNPGPLEEAEFTFTTNHVPGHAVTEWYESRVRCGDVLKFAICYANAKRQIIPEAFIKSYTPQELSADAQSCMAEVVVSIKKDWTWESTGPAA